MAMSINIIPGQCVETIVNEQMKKIKITHFLSPKLSIYIAVLEGEILLTISA